MGIQNVQDASSRLALDSCGGRGEMVIKTRLCGSQRTRPRSPMKDSILSLPVLSP